MLDDRLHLPGEAQNPVQLLPAPHSRCSWHGLVLGHHNCTMQLTPNPESRVCSAHRPSAGSPSWCRAPGGACPAATAGGGRTTPPSPPRTCPASCGVRYHCQAAAAHLRWKCLLNTSPWTTVMPGHMVCEPIILPLVAACSARASSPGWQHHSMQHDPTLSPSPTYFVIVT